MEDSEEPRADVSGSGSSVCYPSFEMLYHFEEDARRKSVGVERLWKLSRNDPTINMFFEAWRHGHFQSFEDMLCKLAVQLATEKAEYMKTATNALVADVAMPTDIVAGDDVGFNYSSAKLDAEAFLGTPPPPTDE